MAEGARRRVTEKTIKWPLPLRGVWNGVDDINVPLDALFDLDNCVIRSGVVTGRPGIDVLDAGAFIFDSRITGALNFFTTDGKPRLVAGSLQRVYSFDYTSWTDRSGLDEQQGTLDDPTRITQFVFGNPPITRAYICNGVTALRSWKDGDSLVSLVANAPVFKDITTAADRLVGLVGAHEVRWGDPLVDDTFPDLNSRLLSETPAETTSIRNMGTLGLIVHKKDSLWVGQVTGSTGASAFCWTLKGLVDGAAGPNAIADVRGVQYYMTQYGRIGQFNGFTHKWVADGLWPIIRDEIDQNFPRRYVAYYHPQQEEIWFHYPRIGDNGEPLGLMILRLKQPDFNYPYNAGLPGVFGKPVTAGVNVAKSGLSVPIVFAGTPIVGFTPSLLTDLNGFWRLEEASGSRGPCFGGEVLTDNNTVTQATGIVGNAAQFTAANSEFLNGGRTRFSPGDSDFFLSWWVQLDSKTANRTIVSKYLTTGDQREYLLTYNSGLDRFTFGVSSDGTSGGNVSVTASSFGSPSTGVLIHVTAWHDSVANTINIQINNGTIDSVSHSGGVFQGTADFIVGALETSQGPIVGADFMDGRIDAGGFWNRIPTASERTALHNSGSGLEVCENLENNKSYTLDGLNDDGIVIDSFFQTGLNNMADSEASRIVEVEPFFERDAGFGSATLKVATSNVLDKPEGTLTPGKTVDLTATPVYNLIGFDARGRFVAIRVEFDSTATVRYRGAILASQVRV